MAEALRPCWKCGGEDLTITEIADEFGLGVNCKNCGIVFCPGVLEKVELITMWNVRASDAGFDELTRENELLRQSVQSYRDEALGWHAQCVLLTDLRGRLEPYQFVLYYGHRGGKNLHLNQWLDEKERNDKL